MKLQRIIYCSKTVDPTPGMIEEILQASERNNRGKFITGMLLFDSGNFLQLIEGPSKYMSSTLFEIAKDTRHQDVQIISAHCVDVRLFPDWGMTYVSTRGGIGDILKRYTFESAFDPSQMTHTGIEKLCMDIAAETVATKAAVAA